MKSWSKLPIDSKIEIFSNSSNKEFPDNDEDIENYVNDWWFSLTESEKYKIQNENIEYFQNIKNRLSIGQWVTPSLKYKRKNSKWPQHFAEHKWKIIGYSDLDGEPGILVQYNNKDNTVIYLDEVVEYHTKNLGKSYFNKEDAKEAYREALSVGMKAKMGKDKNGWFVKVNPSNKIKFVKWLSNPRISTLCPTCGEKVTENISYYDIGKGRDIEFTCPKGHVFNEYIERDTLNNPPKDKLPWETVSVFWKSKDGKKQINYHHQFGLYKVYDNDIKMGETKYSDEAFKMIKMNNPSFKLPDYVFVNKHPFTDINHNILVKPMEGMIGVRGYVLRQGPKGGWRFENNQGKYYTLKEQPHIYYDAQTDKNVIEAIMESVKNTRGKYKYNPPKAPFKIGDRVHLKENVAKNLPHIKAEDFEGIVTNVEFVSGKGFKITILNKSGKTVEQFDNRLEISLTEEEKNKLIIEQYEKSKSEEYFEPVNEWAINPQPPKPEDKFYCLSCGKYHYKGEPEFENNEHYKQAYEDYLDFQEM